MQEISEIDTQETIEESSNETQNSDDTPETSQEAVNQKNFLGNLLGGKPIETSEEDNSNDETEGETKEQSAETTDTPEAETEGTANKFTMKITVDGVDEELNLSDADTFDKVKQWVQQGKHYSQNMQTVKAEKEGFAQWQMQVVSQYLRNLYKDKVVLREPLWRDYDGQFDTEEQDKQRYAEDIELYKQTKTALEDWETGHRKYAQSYDNVINDFRNKYEDMRDDNKLNEFIDKNIKPIIEFGQSCGSKEVPKELFEMVKFYQDKDKIIKDAVNKAVEADRKKRATPDKTATPKSVKVETIADAGMAQKQYLGRLFNN